MYPHTSKEFLKAKAEELELQASSIDDFRRLNKSEHGSTMLAYLKSRLAIVRTMYTSIPVNNTVYTSILLASAQSQEKMLMDGARKEIRDQ